MIGGIRQWVTARFGDGDFITRQRAGVLLLIDVSAALLAVIGAVVGLSTGIIPPRATAIWVVIAIVAAGTVSIFLLHLGKYRAAAHVTVLVFFASVCALNLTEVRAPGPLSETTYLATLIVLPALLLGIAWTVVYGLASLLILIFVTTAHARAIGMPVYSAVDYAIAVLLATVFVTFAASMVSWVYETALARVRSLLAAQQDYITAVTELSESLQRNEAHKRQFYSDTIFSVTSGKLSINEDADVEPYLDSAALRADIPSAAALAGVRRSIEDYCVDQGLVGDRLASFMIGVGEAMTNAVKHAGHGIAYAGRTDDSVWAAVSDEGSGIESLILPRALLLPGFSTKPSLGLGYTIMLDVSDRILLKTSDTGTVVIALKQLNDDPPDYSFEHYANQGRSQASAD